MLSTELDPGYAVYSYLCTNRLLQVLHILFHILFIVVKSTIFWDITPCNPLRVNRRFGGIYRLYLQGRKVSRARAQRESRWKPDPMEAICSSETSVNFQRTTRRYNPKDGTFNNHRCENLESYIYSSSFL
jgi:hypothetical protein